MPPPQVAPGQIAVTVASGIGDYRAGDVIWCTMLAPEGFATALNRDVLVPLASGGFTFGRLIDADDNGLRVLPHGSSQKQITVSAPDWLASAEMLVRKL